MINLVHARTTKTMVGKYAASFWSFDEQIRTTCSLVVFVQIIWKTQPKLSAVTTYFVKLCVNFGILMFLFDFSRFHDIILIFFLQCLCHWLAEKSTCPACRNVITANSSQYNQNVPIQRFVDNLRIDCPYRISGCSVRPSRADLEIHKVMFR